LELPVELTEVVPFELPVELLPDVELLPEDELREGGSTSVELPLLPFEEGMNKLD
jgi:hypothetical protein